MDKPNDILVQVIKAGRKGSGKLARENKPLLIEHLCREFDRELAEQVEKASRPAYRRINPQDSKFDVLRL